MIDFAELSEFEELKLKNYSSGMHVRLAFSVAIQVDADILLVDEVLAVGDAAFQQKCFDVFHRMRDEGRTIVFVTHDMGALKRFCHRALLLERGSIVHLGDPSEVADRYLEINFGRDPDGNRRGRQRGGEARRASSRSGSRTSAASGKSPYRRASGSCSARASLRGRRRGSRGQRVRARRGARAIDRRQQRAEHERSGRFRAGEEVVFSFAFENVLAPGRYSPVFTLAHRGSGLDVMDRFEGAFSFVVTGPQALGGLVDVPVDVAVRRVSGAGTGAAAGELSTPASRSFTVEHPVGPYESLGRPIRGPRALTDDWARFWHLTFNIARNEWKLRFFGSVLGYLWQLVRPLLLFGVLYVFFTMIADVGAGPARAIFYGAQLLGSIVLFTFFAEATAGAVRSVVDNESLVRKIQFPRMVIPLSVVLLAMFNLALNLVVVFVFALSGVRPMLTWLELPLIVGLLAVLRRARDAAVGAVRLLPGHPADLGGSPNPVLRLAGDHPVETVQAKLSLEPWLVHLYMLTRSRRLPAVPPRDDQPCDTERGEALRLALAGPDRHRRRAVRARFLGVQPHGAARGREPLSPHPARRIRPVRWVATRGGAPVRLGGDHPERDAAGHVVDPRQERLAAQRVERSS